VNISKQSNESRETKAKLFALLALLSSVCFDFVLVGFVQAEELSELPLIQANNLTYEGAFRLPSGKVGISRFGYVWKGLSYNPARNSLFATGHAGESAALPAIAEISIPAIRNTLVESELAQASFIQPFADPTDGKVPLTNQGWMIGGHLVYRNRLISTHYIYYDANFNANTSHTTSGLDLSVSNDVAGPYKVGTLQSGFYGGYMTHIPPEWQTVLGGPVFTGQCCVSIISRTSYGPTVSVFDPADLGIQTPVSATTLVGYPDSNPTLGPWNPPTPNDLYNGTVKMGGVVFPDATRSVLFFGMIGTGSFCYGSECDPPRPNAPYAEPYRSQIWAYDALELAKVKAGTKKMWEVVPYSYWPLSLPFGNEEARFELMGAAYDPATRRIFIVQTREERPIIHVFTVNNATPIPYVPPPSLPPPPTGGLTNPTLSLPAFLPINSQITAGYSGSASYFSWNFTPVAGASASRFSSSSQARAASFNTPSPVASLSTAGLELGSYLVTVTAFDSGGRASAPASAQVTLVSANLDQVRVFPNPWRSDRHSTHSITFGNLTVNTEIKIFMTSGHHVKTLPTASSSVTWDLKDEGGDKVASGIYLYVLQAEDGSKKTGKVVIIK
jgi:hypothetical protein